MPKTVTFLLVEDAEADAILIQRSFNKANLLNPLFITKTAENAMLYLLGQGPYKNREEFPMPALVLLDLKLPGANGFEFLQWVRAQPALRDLRVVVITSSDSARDVDRAYKLGANSYLVKPLDFERFVEISLALNGYWVWTDKQPDEASPSGTEPRDTARPSRAKKAHAH